VDFLNQAILMETTISNETAQSLFADLGIDAAHHNVSLDRIAGSNSRYIKDLKLNVSGVLGSANFTRKETALVALSVAVNEKNDTLIKAFEGLAKKEEASDEEIAEVHACTSLMNANNILYRFRHFMHDVEYYNNHPAGLRMSIMMNPVMGKEMFELISLVVSAINGCERCVTSHERSVKEAGASEAKIYDAIRIGSVIKSLCVVI